MDEAAEEVDLEDASDSEGVSDDELDVAQGAAHSAATGPTGEDSGAFSSVLDATTDSDVDMFVLFEGRRMHAQQLLNQLINRDTKALAHSYDRLKRVEVSWSVGPFISPPSGGEDPVDPFDVFVTLANHSDGRCGLAFFSVVRVMHLGQEITVGRSELESSTAEIHCQCLPFEELPDAKLVHWNGRFHQKILVVRGVHATFVKMAVTVSHLWQWTFDQALTMPQALLAAPKPDSVPDIPYPSLSCANSCDRLKSAPGSKRVDCRFPGCGHSTIHALLRGHVGGHFLLGHRWEGQADGDPHLFCLFCGSCDGRCETTLRANGRVHSTCGLAYFKLQVKSASKISKSNPCTNVPVKCSLRTCQKWMCSYASEKHIQQCHTQMPPPYSPIPDSEKELVLNHFGKVPKRKRCPDAPCLPHPSPTASPAPQASVQSDSGSGSTTNSSTSSSTTGSSSSSAVSSASDYIPSGAGSESVSDATTPAVVTRSAQKRKRAVGLARPKPKAKAGQKRKGKEVSGYYSESSY